MVEIKRLLLPKAVFCYMEEVAKSLIIILFLIIIFAFD